MLKPLSTKQLDHLLLKKQPAWNIIANGFLERFQGLRYDLKHSMLIIFDPIFGSSCLKGLASIPVNTFWKLDMSNLSPTRHHEG